MNSTLSSLSLTLPVKYEPAYPIERNPTQRFYPVGGKNYEKMDRISELFKKNVEPLYGSQVDALRKMSETVDRKCFLLSDDSTTNAGVLIFKTSLSNEFAEYGIKNSLEIPSFFVDHPDQKSRKELRSFLLDKLNDEAKLLELNQDGIHVAINEADEESLLFFKENGFL